MQTKNNNIFYHLVAFLTVAIWGTTFVSTKVLMLNGLSPAQIFTLRFSIAYVLMLAFNHRRLFADSWQDEAKMALLGITGGSLYFCSAKLEVDGKLCCKGELTFALIPKE